MVAELPPEDFLVGLTMLAAPALARRNRLIPRRTARKAAYRKNANMQVYHHNSL